MLGLGVGKASEIAPHLMGSRGPVFDAEQGHHTLPRRPRHPERSRGSSPGVGSCLSRGCVHPGRMETGCRARSGARKCALHEGAGAGRGDRALGGGTRTRAGEGHECPLPPGSERVNGRSWKRINTARKSADVEVEQSRLGHVVLGRTLGLLPQGQMATHPH